MDVVVITAGSAERCRRWYDCRVRSLDTLRLATGESDPADALSALSDEVVDDLVERLLAEPPRPKEAVGENEVWPVLNARMSTFATGGGSTWFTATGGPAGINLMAAIDPRDQGTGRFPNGVLRALLYCHGLVLEDPLALAADLVNGTDGELRAVSRSAVRAGAASLAEIAPLVDAGVVQTFFRPRETWNRTVLDGAALARSGFVVSENEVWDAFEAAFVDGLGPELQELWRRVRAGDREPPLSLVEQSMAGPDREVVEVFIGVLAELRPSAVVENALSIVSESLMDLAGLGNPFDLLCPTPLFARLALTGDPRDDLRLFELVSIDVPRIDSLLVQDAVAIRNSSEAFAVWRARLSAGLERARADRIEFGSAVDGAGVVSESLADARAGLFGEVERSRTLSSRVRASLLFAAGALGGAVGNSTGGTFASVVGASGGVLGAICELLVQRGDPVPGYLRRHYVVFDR